MRTVAILLFFLSFNSFTLEPASKIKDRLSKYSCYKEIDKMLKDWKTEESWQIEPILFSNVISFKTPTKTLGAWVRLKFENEDTLFVEKMTRNNILSKTFKKKSNNCNGEVAVRPFTYNEKYLKTAYTDEELQNALSKNKKGIIYIWSPNMPLSVTNLDYLMKHAKKMGVHVTAVVDPATPKEMIKKLVKDGKIKNNQTKPLESFELINRGGLIHFPAFFTYEDGKLSRGPKLGYEDEKQTIKFLKDHF